MPKQEDAHLILKLYELRREETMRKARDWFSGQFFPQSAQDFAEVGRGEHAAHLRMVMSYWEMAAAMVNHGAIDRDLFNDANGEHFALYAKVAPFLPELRVMFGYPGLSAHLETLVQGTPGGEEIISRMQEGFRVAAAAREAANA